MIQLMFTDGPAMTWSLFAIGWLNQGTNISKSQHYFTRGYANVKAPFKVWTETPTGGAVNFITGTLAARISCAFLDTGARFPPTVVSLTCRCVGDDVQVLVGFSSRSSSARPECAYRRTHSCSHRQRRMRVMPTPHSSAFILSTTAGAAYAKM